MSLSISIWKRQKVPTAVTPRMPNASGASLLAARADAVSKETGSAGAPRSSGRASVASGLAHPQARASGSFGFWDLLSPGVLELTFLGQLMDLFSRCLWTDELGGQGLDLVGLAFWWEDGSARTAPLPWPRRALTGCVTCPPSVSRQLPRTKGLVRFLCPAAGLGGLLAHGLPHHLHLPFPPRRGVLPGVPR